jgi:predicted O-methyltransferase YrrM
VITTEAVSSYIAGVRRGPDEVLADMEAHADRDGVPIVHAPTGQLLAVLAAALAPRTVVEVGTAIGVSTLYLARALPEGGRIVSFDVDPERHAAAHDYLRRAGVLDRVDLRLQDARQGLRDLSGPVDLAFIDGVKEQYADYLDGLLPLVRPGGVIAVDNVLMSGTVADGVPAGPWTESHIAAMRAFNERLMADPRLEATVTPVGDGVALAVKLGD